MRVGILGTRGIPNAYGGFEQFAQYLAVGLSTRGHEVFVYNSSDHPYREDRWNGISIIHCRDWEKKLGTAGQFLYDYNCIRDATRRKFDVLLQLGYTSNSVWHRLWPADAINVINMDGLEWKRTKYNRLTRLFLRRAERWAAVHGDMLVADSPGIKDYIRHRYQKESTFIPYGAEIPSVFDADVPARWGLSPGGYWMLMARMEPENNIELILRGWMISERKRPLLLLGNTGNRFGRFLKATYRDDRILFAGAIYDAAVTDSLRHYSDLYFHGHSVGGTNPSLLEAMACGCRIAAHDNIFNRAVLQDDAWYFSTAQEVGTIMDTHAEGPAQHGFREHNLEKLRVHYSWEKIVADYENLFLSSKFAS